MAASRTVLRIYTYIICDFSKEQYGTLRMILGSKHVGAILSVLVRFFYISALVVIIKVNKQDCYGFTI